MTHAELMIWCRGGRSSLKRVADPPPVEIEEDGGVYVLVDDGPMSDWFYEFVAT